MKLVLALPFAALLLPLPPIIYAKLRKRAKLLGAPIWHAYCSAVLIAWWLVHPAILRESTMALLTLPVGNEHYVTSDLSINTASPEYAVTQLLAKIMLCSFVPLLPLLVFGFMFYSRAQLQTKEAQHEASGFLRNTSFYFYGSYKPDKFWWELISLSGKLALVVCACFASVAVDHTSLGKTIFTATWVALVVFVLEVRCLLRAPPSSLVSRPAARDDDGPCNTVTRTFHLSAAHHLRHLSFLLASSQFKYEPYQRKAEGRMLMTTEFVMLALLLLAQGLNIRPADENFRSTLRVVSGSLMLATVVFFINQFVCQHREERQTRKREATITRERDSSLQQSTDGVQLGGVDGEESGRGMMQSGTLLSSSKLPSDAPDGVKWVHVPVGGTNKGQGWEAFEGEQGQGISMSNPMHLALSKTSAPSGKPPLIISSDNDSDLTKSVKL